MLPVPWLPPTSRTSFPLRSKRSGSCGASTFRVTFLERSEELMAVIPCTFRCMGGLRGCRSRARWCRGVQALTGFTYIAGSGGNCALMQGRPWKSRYLSTRNPGRRSCRQTLLRGWRMCRERLPFSTRLRSPCGGRLCSTWFRPNRCGRGRSACNWLCGECWSGLGNGERKREARERRRARDRGLDKFLLACFDCQNMRPGRLLESVAILGLAAEVLRASLSDALRMTVLAC
jgi:hypothetical protein